MKKYKKYELEKLREILKSGEATRCHYLVYAFLRGVPYRVIERKTHWDDNVYYKPGELVYLNFKWEISKMIVELVFDIKNIRQKYDREQRKWIEFTQEQQEQYDKFHKLTNDIRKSPELKEWFVEKKDV